jgi:hypothetical protein
MNRELAGIPEEEDMELAGIPEDKDMELAGIPEDKDMELAGNPEEEGKMEHAGIPEEEDMELLPIDLPTSRNKIFKIYQNLFPVICNIDDMINKMNEEIILSTDDDYNNPIKSKDDYIQTRSFLYRRLDDLHSCIDSQGTPEEKRRISFDILLHLFRNADYLLSIFDKLNRKRKRYI